MCRLIQVAHGDVLVVKTPEWTDDFGAKHPVELIPAKGFKANLHEDTGEVLGIVSDEYEVVDNHVEPRRRSARRTRASLPSMRRTV